MMQLRPNQVECRQPVYPRWTWLDTPEPIRQRGKRRHRASRHLTSQELARLISASSVKEWNRDDGVDVMKP
jgi:hypothetical protein